MRFRRYVLVFTATALAAASAPGEATPTGYLDPGPVLAAATKAIGADRIDCIVASGNAYGGRVGQQRYVKVEGDWPLDLLSNFVRTMNWRAGAMREEFDRSPGETPASFKYGTGWMGGTPTQRHARQMFAVNGKVAWHRDGAQGSVGPIAADIAEMWQLDLWMNPVGFLKAAALPGANPLATWRWELGESGRDGPTSKPKKVSVVSINVLGKYRVTATIDEHHLIQRLQTRVADPVLGDMNFEQEFSPETYADLRDGMRFPVFWHSHQGYDDNFNTQTVSSGHNAFGGALRQLTVNQCDDAIAVPANLPQPADFAKIETRKLANDVYLIGGAPHNSVAIGFQDFVTVVEAPIGEQRSLAVIDAVTRLFPGKPIRYLINTHQHFDSLAGIRSYVHIGATIVTHSRNFALYNRDVINYTPRTIDPDLVSLMPPTEITEGYTYELVKENHVITDGKRLLYINYVQPLPHAEGMLMATLPAERLVIQADMVDTHEGVPDHPSDGATALYNMIQTLHYDVDRIVPIHGPPISWADFLKSTDVAKLPTDAVAGSASGTGLSIGSSIAELAADPRGRAILDRRIPGLTHHPLYEVFKALSLPQLAPNAPGEISQQQVAQVQSDLGELGRN